MYSTNHTISFTINNFFWGWVHTFLEILHFFPGLIDFCILFHIIDYIVVISTKQKQINKIILFTDFVL